MTVRQKAVSSTRFYIKESVELPSSPSPMITPVNDTIDTFFNVNDGRKDYVTTTVTTVKDEMRPSGIDNFTTPVLSKEELMVETIQAYLDSLPKSAWRKSDSYSYSRPAVSIYNRNETIGAEFSDYTLNAFGTLPRNQYDYSDIEYPIPFNTLYNDPSTHYVNYGERNALIPSFVGLGDVSPLAFEESNYIIVTGSSQNHVIPNVNMLLSAVYANCNVSMVFVDFGLDRRGLTLLTSTLTLIHSIHTALHSPAELYYRKFNFAHFPQWMSLQDNAIRGGYAWKVISYYDVLEQTQAVVVWSDGGNLWMDDITQDLKRVKENGIYSPYSGDTIQRWVHGKTRAFLAGHHMLRKLMINKGMCTGGYVLMDYNNAYAMNNVVLPLLQCVYTRKCVAPLGTSRENHRQDQAQPLQGPHVVPPRLPRGQMPEDSQFTAQRDC
ncbi:hypothetical protein BLSTO_04806 [Blastocystis sp. subtype 1]